MTHGILQLGLEGQKGLVAPWRIGAAPPCRGECLGLELVPEAEPVRLGEPGVRWAVLPGLEARERLIPEGVGPDLVSGSGGARPALTLVARSA